MNHRHGPKIRPHHHHDGGYRPHHEHHRPEERKRLLWCILITGGMMIVEFVGGFLTNSLALLSDAGHMFSHLFALSVSYGAILVAGRPETGQKTYGYFRVEILSALFNGLSLLVITGFIFYVAIGRFHNPVRILAVEMLVVALLGLATNFVTAVILFRPSSEDLNIRSAFLHMVGDTLSSVGVVGAAVAIYYTGFLWIDPVVSVVIALVILVWAAKLIFDSVHVLMESTPKHIKLEDVADAMKKEFAEIREIHDLHVWEITSKMYALTAHIVVGDCSLSSTTQYIDRYNVMLNDRFDIQHTTIQIECLKP